MDSFHNLCYAILVVSPVVALALAFYKAPYGRFAETTGELPGFIRAVIGARCLNLSLNSKVAWVLPDSSTVYSLFEILMECPSFFGSIFFFLQGP